MMTSPWALSHGQTSDFSSFFLLPLSRGVIINYYLEDILKAFYVYWRTFSEISEDLLMIFWGFSDDFLITFWENSEEFLRRF